MIARTVGGTVGGTALGDFRDRVRRPAYAVTLLAAVGLGYLAVPDAGNRLVIMYIGEHRGEYGSAYVGTVTALASALWLTLGGFYVVRGAVERDAATGVGRLVAATPLRNPAYLAGKFLANAMVLGSMVGVLAMTAAVMQVARGEDRWVDPVALLVPFALLALPAVALTAAAALLSETIPILRGGVGNIAWFFVWLVGALGGLSERIPVDVVGTRHVVGDLRAAMTEQGLWKDDYSFSLGLTEMAEPLRTFPWDGFAVTPGFAAGRAALVLVAVAVALLPAVWFARFDPARGRHGKPARRGPGAGPAGESAPEPEPTFVHRGPPATAPVRGRTFGRLLAGELALVLRDAGKWWWLVAAGLAAAALAVPSDAVSAVVLPLAWVWPVLLWSRLGTRPGTAGVEGLLGAYPSPGRRLLAEWTAGLAITVLTGLAPLARMVLDADAAGASAWLAGALLVPSLALALGTVSRTPRVFQAVYPPMWYAAFNGLAPLDFMGAVPGGPHPLLVAALAVLFLAVAAVTVPARRLAA
ncbi:hypothetical protein BJF79_33565 [Actinomadura sp. CNU-125]|uniref:hypothetical protein n=1 Tax=Actinomadura sp. CNU-125 TaxID=1904961 RepID=UPI000965715F|nr:hypothetical protein [Actinomadura sp. CNU-125]OLT34265.1 hypothetical protein BJF79_33565 [Actinomadura sp. CNU-125]